MQKSNSTLILKLAAIAAAISVQGVALAQPASAPAASQAEQATSGTPEARRGHHAHGHHSHRGHMHRHHQHQRAVMVVPGYGPLGEKSVEALALNDSQKKLLQEAQEAQKAARSEGFEAMKEKRQARLEAFKAGKIDPRVAMKEAEAARDAMAKRRGEITDKWLAVWDSLDQAQQKQVAQQFADRAEKRNERMQRHAERQAKKAETAKQDNAAQQAAS